MACRDAVSTIIDALVLVLDAQPQQAQRWDELAHALRLAEQHQATLKLVPKLQQRLAWWRRYHFRGTPPRNNTTSTLDAELIFSSLHCSYVRTPLR